jgi:hypothetical protein
MKTFKQIREAKMPSFKISNPTKNLGMSASTLAKDHVKGKVIKFKWGTQSEAGIGTKRYIEALGGDIDGLQKEIIPVIKKNNIRSFSWGGKPDGQKWLERWVKSNKNLRYEETSPDLAIAAKEGYDISKDILKMFKDFNKKFMEGKKPFLNHQEVTLLFIEIQ